MVLIGCFHAQLLLPRNDPSKNAEIISKFGSVNDVSEACAVLLRRWDQFVVEKPFGLSLELASN